MREILFRGKGDKRYNDGEWCLGVPIKCYDGDWQICTDHIRRTVIPETIGQYAGSPDKNNKKIFEGDICKVTMFTCEGKDKHYLCEVCFDCGSFVFRERSGFDILPVDIYDFETDVEVIGNIYDNPELIGGRING